MIFLDKYILYFSLTIYGVAVIKVTVLGGLYEAPEYAIFKRMNNRAKFALELSTSCCGSVEQVRATEGTLNTLNFNEKLELSALRYFFLELTIILLLNIQEKHFNMLLGNTQCKIYQLICFYLSTTTVSLLLYCFILTLLHLERPKLYTILAFLSAKVLSE